MLTGRNCIRRMNRREEVKEFSNHSLLHAVDSFVKSVNDMDETIMVPCRLMDMKVGDDASNAPLKNATGVPANQISKRLLKELSSTDLFNIYSMVNSVKNELLWGSRNSGTPSPEEHRTNPVGSTPPCSTPPVIKGHSRRPSTVSMTSTNSTVSCSDTDSDVGNENDSGMEGEEDYAQQLADSFRQHLHGLYRCLEQLTDAADYVTTRYQTDVGGSV